MINGEPGPSDETLRKLYQQLKPMANEAKRSVAHRRGRVIAGNGAPKLPRQLCSICGIPFDFAAQTKPGIPEISRCSECKQKLASGLTALIGKPKISGEWLFAWVRGAGFMPGEIITNLSEETMKAVKNKYVQGNDN